MSLVGIECGRKTFFLCTWAIENMEEAEDVFVKSAMNAYNTQSITSLLTMLSMGQAKIQDYASSRNRLFKISAWIAAFIVVFLLLPIAISGLFMKLWYMRQSMDGFSVLLAFIALLFILIAKKKLLA